MMEHQQLNGTAGHMELEPLTNGSAVRPPDPPHPEKPLARDVEQGEERRSRTRHRQICRSKRKLIIGGILGVAIIIIIPIVICILKAGAPAQNNTETDTGNGKTVPNGETVDKGNETARDCERLVYVSANNTDGSFNSSYDSCTSKGYELLKDKDIEVRKHCIPQGEDFWIYSTCDCDQCPVYNTHNGVLHLDSTTMRRFLCDPQATQTTDGQI